LGERPLRWRDYLEPQLITAASLGSRRSSPFYEAADL